LPAEFKGFGQRNFIKRKIINTTQAILENIQVSCVERSVIDAKLTHSLDCYQTQRGLCSTFGTNPRIADCDCDSSYQIRCRWRNAYRGAASCREIHSVLSDLLETHHRLTSGIRILHKIHTFVEAQTENNRVKSFFRQGGISTLFKVCQAGLPQSFEFFKVCCQFYVATIHGYIFGMDRLKDPELYQILQRCGKTLKGDTMKCSI
jgi:hypothetical protein